MLMVMKKSLAIGMAARKGPGRKQNVAVVAAHSFISSIALSVAK